MAANQRSVFFKPHAPKQTGLCSTTALISELRQLVGNSPACRAEMLTAMRALWNCAALDRVASDLVHCRDADRARLILESAEWVFQWQDISEWPDHGRQRPLMAIEEALAGTS